MKIDNNIEKVVVGNVEIKRIFSRGGVIWQRPYKWKKYKLQSNYTSYDVEKIGEKYIKNFDYPYEGYSGVSIVNGKIVLSGEKRQIFPNGIYYFELDGKFYKVDVYELSDGYGKYTTFRDTYELYIYKGTEQEFSHYSKGEFIEEVKSKNKNEYPSNGYKGSYWYEFIE